MLPERGRGGPALQRDELQQSRDARSAGLGALIQTLPFLLLEISLRSRLTSPRLLGAAELGFGIHYRLLPSRCLQKGSVLAVSRPAALR